MTVTKESTPGEILAKQIIEQYNPKSVADMQNALKDIFGPMFEAMLQVEMKAHLGYESNDHGAKTTENRRNGYTSKKIKTSGGEVDIKVPRDRDSSFEPMLVPKRKKDVSEIEQKVLAMYARGMSQRDISATIEDIYGFEISHDTISQITDCVLEELNNWQNRPLKKMYTFLFVDCMYVTIRKEYESKTYAVYTFLVYIQSYKAVHIPTDEDNAVKEYIRMRDDVNDSLKRLKQQITVFCIRNGKIYRGVVGKSYWTKKHLNWLEKLEFNHPVLKETLEEYIALFYVLCEKVETYDAKIAEISQTPRFEEPVKKACCLLGIATHTAMATISEISDFTRFPSAESFAAYLGLVPGEHSSSNKRNQLGITKQGNTHIRRLLVEAAQSYTKGQIGKKSVALKKRQAGMDSKIVAYADKCAERLKRKYVRIALHSNRNIAKTAVVRELACFIWGLMTDNYGECRGNVENRPKIL